MTKLTQFEERMARLYISCGWSLEEISERIFVFRMRVSKNAILKAVEALQ